MPAAPIHDRCIAWNLLYDHRVTADRADAWFRRNGAASSPQSILHALGNEEVLSRRAPFETYLNRHLNFENILGGWVPGTPAPDESLVHVFDLAGAYAQRIWVLGIRNGIRGLSRIDPANSATIASTIQRVQDSGGERRLIAGFLEAQRKHLDEKQEAAPVWVTRWDEWRQRIDPQRPETWAEAVGLRKPFARRPLIVLCYPVSHARLLVRPSQLDAGQMGRHFPSPPHCPIGGGGRVVQGGGSSENALVEFIHAPVPWTLGHWEAAGLPVAFTQVPIGQDSTLRADRDQHWQVLGQEFTVQKVQDWMPNSSP